jgi:hypothetical protein
MAPASKRKTKERTKTLRAAEPIEAMIPGSYRQFHYRALAGKKAGGKKKPRSYGEHARRDKNYENPEKADTNDSAAKLPAANPQSARIVTGAIIPPRT